MQITNKIKDFLSNYPLYKEFLYVENYVRTSGAKIEPFDFKHTSFDYFCNEENSIKTFELKMPIATEQYYGKFASNEIHNDFFDEEGKLDYTQHFDGICKSCQKKQMDLTIQVYSNKEIPRDRDNITFEGTHIDIVENKNINVYFKKIGIYPEPEIKIDKRIQKYFDRETNTWFYKGIKLYNSNYGIGSFAYFRRIIEKELFNILQDVSKLPSTDANLKKMIEEYIKTNQISVLYKNSFNLLPKSLQLLGDNPFEILYRLTSKGLHILSEDECLENADKVHKILEYVVLKINEEKSELLEIRNIIKSINK